MKKAQEKKKVKSKLNLKSDKRIVERALRKYLDNLKGPCRLRDAVKYSVFSGGKRLRPLLVLESCRACNGNVKKAIPFASAIEFIHNFSLIHDDLPAMDNDNFRRGKPTCHRKFGEGVAILAGDALLNLTFEILSKSRDKYTLQILYNIARAIGTEGMVGGQVLDLEHYNYTRRNARISNKINKMKTASLMAVSCKIGAMIAHAKAGDVKRMHEFGKNLGLAFQIADDIHDVSYGSKLSRRMHKEIEFYIIKGKKNIISFREKADSLKYIADSVLKKVKNRT